jgi:hypothetical protein
MFSPHFDFAANLAIVIALLFVLALQFSIMAAAAYVGCRVALKRHGRVAA